jgi:hypothetical protein
MPVAHLGCDLVAECAWREQSRSSRKRPPRREIIVSGNDCAERSAKRPRQFSSFCIVALEIIMNEDGKKFGKN